MMPPVLKVCKPVHVGMMDCESAGAPSERINVDAEPLTAESPAVPVGFAPVAVEHVEQVTAFVASEYESGAENVVVAVCNSDQSTLDISPVTPDAALLNNEDVAVNVGTAVAPVPFASTVLAAAVPKAVVIAVEPEPVTAPVNVIDWLPVRYVFVSTERVPTAPPVFTNPFVARFASRVMYASGAVSAVVEA
jgi:hypothetical protein